MSLGAHPHDIEKCPNRACKALTWHGLPVGDEAYNADKPYFSKLPYCPGSYLFDDDGNRLDEN